jgi:hypothetical protein
MQPVNVFDVLPAYDTLVCVVPSLSVMTPVASKAAVDATGKVNELVPTVVLDVRTVCPGG